jgi:hypothetical protein
VVAVIVVVLELDDRLVAGGVHDRGGCEFLRAGRLDTSVE